MLTQSQEEVPLFLISPQTVCLHGLPLIDDASAAFPLAHLISEGALPKSQRGLVKH